VARRNATDNARLYRDCRPARSPSAKHEVTKETAMSLTARLVALLAFSIALCAPDGAEAQQTKKRGHSARSVSSTEPRPFFPTEQALRERINKWTVGLAGGLLEGAPIRLATEIARVVNDGENMHVLPIVPRGPTENVNDLLYLKGVDLAIISSDSLEEYKSQVPDIQRRLTYILNLFPSELHVFARPEIRSLQDLAGKKVNFNTQGTAAAFSGPLIFSRLGLNVEKMFIPHPVALEQMRRGEISAVVFITSKPIDAFLKGRWDPGFKFLPVSYDTKFEDYYVPTSIESTDYPNLIAKGERVETIAVPTILTAYNWRPNTVRYQRVARFVEYLFNRIDKLQAPGFDAKWKDINLNAKVPGLERFGAAQQWLNVNAAKVGMRP
jgi:TRAP-type uncharacterized transport system substrate-binding protein